MVFSLLMSTLVQWFLFLLLPMACYAIFMRKHYKFGEMFGLQKASSLPQREMQLLVGLNIFFLVYNEWRLTHYGLYLEDIRYQAYQNFGWSGRTILIILVYSLIKTSFLEELVFRGFMINALRLFFSLRVALHLQAFLFMLVHTIGLVLLQIPAVDVLVSSLIVYLLAYYFGRLFIKSGYSILYTSIWHGGLNLLAAFIDIFCH